LKKELNLTVFWKNVIIKKHSVKKWKREKLKSKKTDMLRSIGKQFRGIRRVSPAEDRKGRLRWEGFG